MTKAAFWTKAQSLVLLKLGEKKIRQDHESFVKQVSFYKFLLYIKFKVVSCVELMRKNYERYHLLSGYTALYDSAKSECFSFLFYSDMPNNRFESFSHLQHSEHFQEIFKHFLGIGYA